MQNDRIIAFVMAGGQGSRLYELTNWRAKPAMYFGGKFRLIFFFSKISRGARGAGPSLPDQTHSAVTS